MARLMRTVEGRVEIVRTGIGRGKLGKNRPKIDPKMSQGGGDGWESDDLSENEVNDREEGDDNEMATGGGATRAGQRKNVSGGKAKNTKKSAPPGTRKTRQTPKKAKPKPKVTVRTSGRRGVKKGVKNPTPNATPSPKLRRSPRTPVKKGTVTPSGTPRGASNKKTKPFKGTPKKGTPKKNSPKKTSPPKPVEWTLAKEEKLVELWEDNENLYNLKHKGYRDNRGKELTLQGMATELGATVAEMRKHMESMRTTFSKVAEVPSGSATDDLRPREQVIHRLCMFLKPHVVHRVTQSSYVAKKKKETKGYAVCLLSGGKPYRNHFTGGRR